VLSFQPVAFEFDRLGQQTEPAWQAGLLRAQALALALEEQLGLQERALPQVASWLGQVVKSEVQSPVARAEVGSCPGPAPKP
jgi:hypothetical protein